MRTLLLLALAIMLTFSVACRKGATVQNVHANTVTAISQKVKVQDVRKAILSACAFRGWQARELSPGLIEASLLVRGKHTVVVDIPYTAETYSIQYKNSINMEYDASKGSIHPNYNKWVGTLNSDINAQIIKLGM